MGNEKSILQSITSSSTFVPLALKHIADANYLYTIFKANVACSLNDLMDKGTFTEPIAKFMWHASRVG